MRFTDDEWMLMMLYSPGTRPGLIAELQKMQKSLTGRDRNLRRWTASLLAKLAEMTDAEYEALDLYPDEIKERRKKTDDDENGLLYADGAGSCGTDHWKQRAVDSVSDHIRTAL